jgi:hypothetical protein
VRLRLEDRDLIPDRGRDFSFRYHIQTDTHGRNEKFTKKFWSENLKGRDDSEDLDVDGMLILKRLLGKLGGKMWTGFIWLTIETSGGFL